MEQRRAQRFDMKLPFELIRSGSGSVSGETMNVSSGGVLFLADAKLRIGEPIEYLITLPATSGRGGISRLRCVGKIVRFAEQAGIAATLERYEFMR